MTTLSIKMVKVLKNSLNLKKIQTFNSKISSVNLNQSHNHNLWLTISSHNFLNLNKNKMQKKEKLSKTQEKISIRNLMLIKMSKGRNKRLINQMGKVLRK